MADQLDVDQRFYKEVAASTTLTQDFIVPNGAVLALSEIGGTASPAAVDTHFEIVWDPAGANTILLATYANSVQSSLLQFTGDGVKVMRIKLVNTDLHSKFLGGYFVGRLY